MAGSYKRARETMTIEDALHNYEDIDSLRDELQQWKEGMGKVELKIRV